MYRVPGLYTCYDPECRLRTSEHSERVRSRHEGLHHIYYYISPLVPDMTKFILPRSFFAKTGDQCSRFPGVPVIFSSLKYIHNNNISCNIKKNEDGSELDT